MGDKNMHTSDNDESWLSGKNVRTATERALSVASRTQQSDDDK